MFNKKLLFVATLLCSRSFLWGMEEPPKETLEEASQRCLKQYEYPSSGVEATYNILSRAALNNDGVCIEALVRHDRKKYDPNQRDGRGETPLFLLARNFLYGEKHHTSNEYRAFITFLKLGAKTHLKNDDGETIEDICEEYLKHNCRNPKSGLFCAFKIPSEEPKTETLSQPFEQCLRQYEYPSSGVEATYNLLNRAALNSDAFCLKTLVQHDREKFNPNQKDSNGETPLFLVARNYLYSKQLRSTKEAEAFETLLKLGAKTDLKNDEGKTIEDIRKAYEVKYNCRNPDSHLDYPVVLPMLGIFPIQGLFGSPLKFTPRN